MLTRASLAFLLFTLASTSRGQDGPGYADPKNAQHFVWSKAHRVPSKWTSEESGYFSIVEGANGKLYVGTAKYHDNAYLIEFDRETGRMREAVDVEKSLGVDRSGFAAQAKIHTRNNVGRSGRIYFGSKQGYPREGESRSEYAGGHPMWYDPDTGKTRVYDIPVPHQGVISVTPDESRGVAYISTCSDERPIESTHFMVLDLESGKYQDLLDCRHMYAFIVIDHRGRAYHPVLGGEIARYDPSTKKLVRLKQTIDGQPPTAESLLAHPKSHPINWEVSPDRKTLYAVAMSGNQLFAYDLTGDGSVLKGRSLGPLCRKAAKTDCRAMCVDKQGVVWAGVAATFPERGQFLHVVSCRPGDPAPVDHGPIAISNPGYAELRDASGKVKKHHHGVYSLNDELTLPRYVVMGICAADDGRVCLTTLYPFTIHELRIPKVAGLATEYRRNAHADVILTRLLETDTMDGNGENASLRLASLHTDQRPKNDTSRSLAKKHGTPLYETIRGALTAGGGRLAVDGVLLVAEHGKYPRSDTGQTIYPKRRMFQQVVDTFQATGNVVPVFSDKHLADNWKDAKWMYDTATEMKIPLMAGSSLPVLWRHPPRDVRRGAKLEEIVVLSYGGLDSYGFHGLEVLQCLAERRAGGETGVESVRCYSGDAAWQAKADGIVSSELLDAAFARLARPPRKGKDLQQLVRAPVMFSIRYQDGLAAHVLTLNGAVSEWSAAWRYGGHDSAAGTIESTRFATQNERPYHHFNHLLLGIERMMHTGQPTWPVERTLLTSGMLDALLTSKRDGGKRLATPWLDVRYQSKWSWRQPPPPPPGQN